MRNKQVLKAQAIDDGHQAHNNRVMYNSLVTQLENLFKTLKNPLTHETAFMQEVRDITKNSPDPRNLAIDSIYLARMKDLIALTDKYLNKIVADHKSEFQFTRLIQVIQSIKKIPGINDTNSQDEAAAGRDVAESIIEEGEGEAEDEESSVSERSSIVESEDGTPSIVENEGESEGEAKKSHDSERSSIVESEDGTASIVESESEGKSEGEVEPVQTAYSPEAVSAKEVAPPFSVGASQHAPRMFTPKTEKTFKFHSPKNTNGASAAGAQAIDPIKIADLRKIITQHTTSQDQLAQKLIELNNIATKDKNQPVLKLRIRYGNVSKEFKDLKAGEIDGMKPEDIYSASGNMTYKLLKLQFPNEYNSRIKQEIDSMPDGPLKQHTQKEAILEILTKHLTKSTFTYPDVTIQFHKTTKWINLLNQLVPNQKIDESAPDKKIDEFFNWCDRHDTNPITIEISGKNYTIEDPQWV